MVHGQEGGPMGMIDVGGYALYAERAGAGGPAVLLEAGGAGTTADWAAVLPEVARFAEVLSYDRPGSGRSDRSPLPDSPERRADEGRAVLLAAGVPSPWVLVGASIGGLIMRVLAHRHPDEVAGVVLVDAIRRVVDAARTGGVP